MSFVILSRGYFKRTPNDKRLRGGKNLEAGGSKRQTRRTFKIPILVHLSRDLSHSENETSFFTAIKNCIYDNYKEKKGGGN